MHEPGARVVSTLTGKQRSSVQLLKDKIARGLRFKGTDARGAPMTMQPVDADRWQLLVNTFGAVPVPLPVGAAAAAAPPLPPPPPPRAKEEESESSAEEEEEAEEEGRWVLGDGGGGYWDVRADAAFDCFAWGGVELLAVEGAAARGRLGWPERHRARPAGVDQRDPPLSRRGDARL